MPRRANKEVATRTMVGRLVLGFSHRISMISERSLTKSLTDRKRLCCRFAKGEVLTDQVSHGSITFMARQDPAARLSQLVKHATEVFIDRGYKNTQMDDIASSLGVAKGTLYVYVESKEALFDLV